MPGHALGGSSTEAAAPGRDPGARGFESRLSPQEYWLAGLLEGEGAFMVTKQGQQPRLVVSMTDEDVIARVAEMWGTAVVPLKPQKAHHKPAFKASIYGRRALEWMLRLRPLLGERRRARIDEIQAAWVDRPVRRKRCTPTRLRPSCRR